MLLAAPRCGAGITKTNRQGNDVPGFLIDGVCLIRDRQEFDAARCQTYAIVRDVVTRRLLESRFWEQVREQRLGPGPPFLPFYHTNMSLGLFGLSLAFLPQACHLTESSLKRKLSLTGAYAEPSALSVANQTPQNLKRGTEKG